MASPPPGYDLTEAPSVDGLRGCYNAGVSDIPVNRFVAGTERSIALPTAITTRCLGVTFTAAPAKKFGTVATRGKVWVEAGTGGITAGQPVMPEANTGRGILWTAAADDNAAMGGTAFTTAAEGQLFECELSAPGALQQG